MSAAARRAAREVEFGRAAQLDAEGVGIHDAHLLPSMSIDARVSVRQNIDDCQYS